MHASCWSYRKWSENVREDASSACGLLTSCLRPRGLRLVIAAYFVFCLSFSTEILCICVISKDMIWLLELWIKLHWMMYRLAVARLQSDALKNLTPCLPYGATFLAPCNVILHLSDVNQWSLVYNVKEI
jgi:hypothetical protein